jgi:glycosyltransferase involved in cell wall biosynthesis
VRILHISSARQLGPTECHIVELCRGLQKRGHEVFVALRPTNEWADSFDFLPEKHILHVSIRNPFGVLSGKKIAAYVRKHQIDIVHAHLPRDYFPGSLACTLAKTSKFVLSRHQSQQLKPFNRFALKNLSAAIATSKDIERSLSILFPPQKLCVVPSGIDVEYFGGLDKNSLSNEFRQFNGIPSEATLVTMIGNIQEDGGQQQFVLAAAEIAKQNPLAHFLLIGTDSTSTQHHRRELLRLVDVLDFKGNFHFLNHAADSHSIFSATDVLIPGFNWEYPGREVLEAIALGAAVLQPNVPRTEAFYQISEVLIEKPDALEIANAISRLINDKELQNRVLNDLRHFLALNHSMDSTAATIEKVYTEMK